MQLEFFFKCVKDIRQNYKTMSWHFYNMKRSKHFSQSEDKKELGNFALPRSPI